MKKRFLSLVLALSLALTFLVPAYAADMVSAEKDVRSLVRYSVTAEEFQALEQDVQFLDENGMGRQMLTSIEKINGKETFVYQLDDQIVSCVSYDVLGNGDTLLNITEGEKHDRMLIKSSGRIFLNGNPVTVTEEASETNEVTPRDGSSYTTTTCPYGSASDYSKQGRQAYTANVEFNNVIKNLTRAAISIVLGNFFPDFSAILSALAAVVDALGDDDPTTGAASFIRTYDTHATKGYYVSSDGGMHLGVYKVVFNCYSKTNYAGYLRTCVVYQCKTLY